jgi:WD40 repeat protein
VSALVPASPRANPYIGPRSFEEKETLYGRDRELSRLTDRLIAERIVLLHSPSGAGKTSLMQAGLIPVMRVEGFHVHPVIRLNRQNGVGPGAGLPPEANRYLLSVLLSLDEQYPPEQRYALPRLGQMSLDEYLRCRAEEDRREAPELLVFDQFEEVITVDPAGREEKFVFFTQLGTALRNRSIWALFAMREDFVGALEPYVRLVPTFFSNTFYLDLLEEAAAREAVQKPAHHAGVTFTEEAAHKLVDDLRHMQVQRPDGSLESVPGPYVEPVQLQVVCYRLWDSHLQRRPDDLVIDLDDISGVGNVDQSLGEYYAASVRAAVLEPVSSEHGVRVPERSVREWFEHQLITPEGIRSQVLRGAETSGGLPNGVVQRLVDSHIVRAEDRAGKTWYELAHDRLIAPVRRDNAGWFARNLNLLQQQAGLWAQRGRSEGLLLRGKELTLAEEAAQRMSLTGVENDFLEACRLARERAACEKQRTRAISILAVAAIISLVIAVIQSFQVRSSAFKIQKAAVTQASLAGTLVVESTAANASAGTAVANRKTAEAEKDRADRQTQVNLVRQLAMQAQAVLIADQTNLELGMLLFREAANQQHRLGVGDIHELRTTFLNMMLSAPRPLKTLHGHTKAVLKVAISPDSRWIASASADGTVRVWEIATGKALFVLTGHQGPVNSVAFLPGLGPVELFSAGEDGTIRRWKWANEHAAPQSEVLLRLGKPLNTLAVSPAGKLATGGEDQAVHIYELGSHRVYTLQENSGIVYGLAFNADGSALVTTTGPGDLREWNMNTGELLNQGTPFPRITQEGWIRGLAFAPDGGVLVPGEGYAVYEYYFSESYSDILIQHTSATRDIAYSPDGLRAASAGEDWLIGYYNPGYNTTMNLSGHRGPVNSVAFSTDSKWLVSGGEDGKILVWNALFPYIVHSLISPAAQGRRWNVEGMVFSPDSKVLATSNWDNSIRFWDVEKGVILNEFYPNQGTLGVISMSPDGKKVAFSAGAGPHRVWDTQGNVLMTLDIPADSGVYGTGFSPDGKWLATDKDAGKTVCWWGLVGQGNICEPIPGDRIATRFEFLPDGKTMATASDTEVLLWDMTVTPPKPRVLGVANGFIFGLAISRDGKWLAAGDGNFTVRLWNLETENPEPLIMHNSGRFARSVAFSADGKLLVSANEDWRVRWWDVESGEPLIAPLQVGHDRLDSAAFSPDGRYMVIGGFDSTIDLWPGNDQIWEETACEVANRNLTRAEYAHYVNPDPAAYAAVYARYPTCPGYPIEP